MTVNATMNGYDRRFIRSDVMTIDEFTRFIRNRTKQELPGREAHLRMAPSPIDGVRNYRLSPEGEAYSSSVMVLLFPDDNRDLNIVFTHRTETIVHGCQISFPGGQNDPGETPVETALRETEEEIGVSRDHLQVAGTLSALYLHRSNNLITPVIGFHEGKPELNINPVEVQEAFTVPLNAFLEDEKLVKEPWTLNDKTYEVPYWDVHKVPLWGATAMILNELLDLYKEFREL
jgi:8-oxo-dGTP pyrophosphatase MutT (NUDIX family)